MAKSNREKAQNRKIMQVCRKVKKSKNDSKSFWACVRTEKAKLKKGDA